MCHTRWMGETPGVGWGVLVGHYAPALAAWSPGSRVPLWALFLAAQAVDVLYFGLVFAGVEGGALHAGEAPRFEVTHGVWSHSLLMTLVYVVATVGVGGLVGRWREGVVLGVVLGSHWLCDLVVHAPDLPLTLEQGTAVGFGLWRAPVVAMVLECVLVLAATRRGGRRGRRSESLGLAVAGVARRVVRRLPHVAGGRQRRRR